MLARSLRLLGLPPLPRLPEPPSPAELARHVPSIAPVRSAAARPFWSVMVPNYNCDAYLGEALASVLAQDPGPAEMQIEVVDDRSTQGDPEALVARVGRGRVVFHRNAENLGATQTFNVCLERARGQWVHILHSDDAILSGFYAAYRQLIERHDGLAMVIGKSVIIDERDRWWRLAGPDPPDDGPVIRDFCAQQAVHHLGQFASWVTRREILERVGGFCTLFRHSADVELAFRIGQAGPVGCVPRAYALYRVHSASDTRKLLASGRNIYEQAQVIRLNLDRLGPDASAPLRGSWRRVLAVVAHDAAWTLDADGSTEGRLLQASWAYVLDPRPFRAWFLAKSWLKHRLGRLRAGPAQRQPP